MFSYVPLSKDPHANVLPHTPFRDVAIWFATMIRKTTDAAALGCVNELDDPKALLCREQEEVMTNPDLVLLKHHEIEMLNPLSSIVAHTLLEGDQIDDVADVFVDEGVSA